MGMNVKMKVSYLLVLCGLAGLCAFMMPTLKAEAAGPVIVIDAGHGGTGGTNEGAMYNGYMEKNLTLVIANAMAEELSKYEGITVYQTRTTDTEISLTDRAAYAASVHADFLYSIHLNASAAHDRFGSEVWVSAFTQNYVKGYTFGTIAEEELAGLGIYSKGVKTKLGKNGDYYGIIRNCDSYGIPSCIIEHCYMDNTRDSSFYDSNEKLAALGKADATAVAKYYGLKSTELGVDYSGYQKVKVSTPTSAVTQDTTAPEVCQITSVSYDSTAKTAVINLKASDSNGKVIYYDYSINGGITYSSFCKFDTGGDNGNISINLKGGSGTIICRAYNQYDGVTTSNTLQIY